MNRSTGKNAGGKNGVEELAGERTKDGVENNRAACLRGKKGRKEGRETGPGIKIFKRRARKILSRA